MLHMPSRGPMPQGRFILDGVDVGPVTPPPPLPFRVTVVHSDAEFMAACLWPDLVTTLPHHHGGCSNQNVLHPLGYYMGVAECGCRGRTQC